MTRPAHSPARATWVAALLLSTLLVPAGGCTEHDGLVLLDLRSSGALVAPMARIRLSAPGWDTRVVSDVITLDGLRVGYYGPADGGPVSVTAEALDAANCVLGRGSATVPMLAAGGTSDPITLFVRPLPATDCTVPEPAARD